MNHNEILKSILPELTEEEIEELNQSIERKANTAIDPIEIKEEITVQEPQRIDFNKMVDNEGAFLSLAYRLGEERRHERVFNRVFDKQRDLNTINGYGWDSTVNWLTNNLHAQPAKSMEFLISVYRTVELMYLRNRANGVDQWNDDRFKDFEKWVFKSLGDLLSPSKNQILDKSKSSTINGLLFKDLFISESVYNKVIELMIAKDRFLEDSDKLIFIPSRKGCKYEIEAFRQALSFKQVLKPTKLTINELLSIYKNSFNIHASDKNLRSKSIPDSVKKYLSILTDIS
jgi:hypothetical protein